MRQKGKRGREEKEGEEGQERLGKRKNRRRRKRGGGGVTEDKQGRMEKGKCDGIGSNFAAGGGGGRVRAVGGEEGDTGSRRGG